MYTCKVSGLCLIMGNRRFQKSLFVGKGRGTMVVFDKLQFVMEPYFFVKYFVNAHS